jgi:hypothetical protein
MRFLPVVLTSIVCLDDGFERVKLVGPEAVHPLPERRQPGGIYAIDPSGARGFVPDEACLLQDLQVLRDRRLRYWHGTR